MKPLKASVKSIFHKFGYEIGMYRPSHLGESPFSDIRKLMCNSTAPIVFDVGANVGQTTESFKEMFSDAQIHAFEPGMSAFEKLEKRYGSHKNIILNKVGVGSSSETKIFLENSRTEMSSFLPLGPDGWGKIVNKVPVEIITLDDYCAKKQIPYLNVLKVDTQGLDLEVLKGAQNIFAENRVQFLLMEVTFNEMYQGLPRFDEIFRFLTERNFKLVSFYKFYYQNELASWTDCLFLNPAFAQTNADSLRDLVQK